MPSSGGISITLLGSIYSNLHAFEVAHSLILTNRNIYGTTWDSGMRVAGSVVTGAVVEQVGNGSGEESLRGNGLAKLPVAVVTGVEFVCFFDED